MARLLSMNLQVIASSVSTTQKMRKSKSSLVHSSMPLVKLRLLATSIGSMYITSMPKGHNG